MKKVFISGSRGFTYLPINFKEAIEWLVELGSHEFLVGDCAGTDMSFLLVIVPEQIY